jgi:pSer/pThr/pTyr-binding forkhead associated (FHA) protein
MALANKLDAIEKHLQKLIEGSASRITSGPDVANLLTHKLVEAMASETTEEGDLILAPNHYTVILPSGFSSEFKNHPALITDLTKALAQAGEEAGVTFPSALEIAVIEDQSVPPGSLEIVARTVYTAATATKTLLPAAGGPDAIPPNAFLIISGHQVYQISQMVVNIGRRPDNNLVIDDPSVSRVHAQLRAIRGQMVLFDLESTGGTYVNGQRVTSSILYPGDVISLAHTQLVYGQDAPRSLDDSPSYTRPSPVDQRKTVTNSGST